MVSSGSTIVSPISYIPVLSSGLCEVIAELLGTGWFGSTSAEGGEAEYAWRLDADGENELCEEVSEVEEWQETTSCGMAMCACLFSPGACWTVLEAGPGTSCAVLFSNVESRGKVLLSG